MNEEAALREKPEKRSIRASSHPDDPIGSGAGLESVPPAACATRRYELELEVQLERDADTPGLDKFHVHLRCFAVRELERRNADQRPAPRPRSHAVA